ncbi:CAMK family protein kinase [Tritrichomonas foetus]|uniref:CAMK family protein kinase n=1 Tax=Tritrichomonas foetus TaxID=1144522 RepID=A0A1J4K909_9EUKA|nr:CAMK family protein kinase [Tritrichomonas foetus]|eukprot:OHT07895.1 CAMK family protein kinase [Tritrichomonas foetus]
MNIPAFIGPYQFIEPIGEGSFGQVLKCVHRPTGLQFACKVINIRYIKEDQKTYENFKNELTANSQMTHPGIVRLFDVQCDNNNIYLILELCPGGTLENLVRSSNGLSEPQALFFFSQIMRVIEYIHNQSYAHRDVTLNNILIGADGHAKLTDFGLCKRRPISSLCTTMCGTFVYISPEIITKQQYDAFKVDIWSAGICLYSMVSNHLPWMLDDTIPTERIFDETAKQICSGEIMYDDTMSEELKDLLSTMLRVDPDERATPSDILSHIWFQNQQQEDEIEVPPPDPNLVNLVQSLISQLDVITF